MGKGNLAEKRGSSGNKVGGGAIVEKGGGGRGSRLCILTGVGYGRKGVGTGVVGILVLESSGRRNSEPKKVLGSKGPGQLFRACRRVFPERGVNPEEEEEEAEDGISGPRIPLLKRESAMGPKLGGSRKFEDVGVCGGR